VTLMMMMMMMMSLLPSSGEEEQQHKQISVNGRVFVFCFFVIMS